MGKFGPADLDAIRDGLSLSGIIGRHVIWDKRKTRAAKGDYWACCPFHSEKSPSFHVDDRKGMYHCFGCGKTGDHFRFLMELEHRDFPDVVRDLAQQAGVRLPENTPAEQAKAAERLTVIEANDCAQAWFADRALLPGTAQASYLTEQRGLKVEEVAHYRLGYAPGGGGLKSVGDGRDLLAAGLLGETDGRTWDYFRNRIMFPVLDARDHVLGFSGRTLAADEDRKYLNSPATSAFDKGALLYNGAAARKAAWDGKQLVVVEGNFDVIMAERAGFAAAAPMGTAITETHVKLIAKAAEAPVLCFDGDAAGRKAADRALDLILPAVSGSFAPTFATLPDGQDPDSLVRRSADAFAAVIRAAVGVADAVWRRETYGAAMSLPETKAKAQGRLRDAVRKIADPDTRKAIGEDIADRLNSLGDRPRVWRSNGYSNHSTSPAALRLTSNYKQAGLPLKDAILIGAIASAPHAAMGRIEDLTADERISPEAVTVINKMIGAMMGAPEGVMAEILAATGLADVVEEAVHKANAAGVDLRLGAEDSTAGAGIIAGIRRH